MPRKSGQARTLTPEQFQELMVHIENHRHPEKNAAIMCVSFLLGLRVQEIALLEIKDIATLQGPASARGFTLNEIMKLPAAVTKGANATKKGETKTKATYNRRVVRFKLEDFDNIVSQIVQLARAGVEVDPKLFYPAIDKRKGKSRDLPMAEPQLRHALNRYLTLRLATCPSLLPSDPVFVSQKFGTAYQPNSLQEHMSLMLRGWAGVEGASSHSGRRTLATDILHRQKKPIRVAQSLLGHVDPATTLIYTEPTENDKEDALVGVGKEFRG